MFTDNRFIFANGNFQSDRGKITAEDERLKLKQCEDLINLISNPTYIFTNCAEQGGGTYEAVSRSLEGVLNVTSDAADVSLSSVQRSPPFLRSNSSPKKKFVESAPCQFCANNKRYEVEETQGMRFDAAADNGAWKNHRLKDSDGNIECPVLFKYTCPECGATGAKAHTVRYCPKKKNRELRSLSSGSE